MRHLMILLAVPLCSLLMTSRPAAAASLYRTVYKVEVEYWFFDTDYSYWSTILETTDQQEAQLMYELLEYAHENGDLNSVVPNSYGRYIAVDVRLRTEYDLIAPPLRWGVGPVQAHEPAGAALPVILQSGRAKIVRLNGCLNHGAATVRDQSRERERAVPGEPGA